jgi:hypothetical protein
MTARRGTITVASTMASFRPVEAYPAILAPKYGSKGSLMGHSSEGRLQNENFVKGEACEAGDVFVP